MKYKLFDIYYIEMKKDIFKLLYIVILRFSILYLLILIYSYYIYVISISDWKKIYKL